MEIGNMKIVRGEDGRTRYMSEVDRKGNKIPLSSEMRAYVDLIKLVNSCVSGGHFETATRHVNSSILSLDEKYNDFLESLYDRIDDADLEYRRQIQ